MDRWRHLIRWGEKEVALSLYPFKGAATLRHPAEGRERRLLWGLPLNLAQQSKAALGLSAGVH